MQVTRLVLVAASVAAMVVPIAGADAGRTYFPIVRSGASVLAALSAPNAPAGAPGGERFFMIDRRATSAAVSPAAHTAPSSAAEPPLFVRYLAPAKPLPRPEPAEDTGKGRAAARPPEPEPRAPAPEASPPGPEPRFNTPDHLWPIESAAESRVSSRFGWRRDPITGAQAFHAAVDIAAAAGTPVIATAAGRVHAVGDHPRLGRYVMVSYADGSIGTYGHLQSVGVAAGEAVDRGQFLGTVGRTGRTTGPHLHFGVEVAGRHIDPLTLIERPELLLASN